MRPGESSPAAQKKSPTPMEVDPQTRATVQAILRHIRQSKPSQLRELEYKFAETSGKDEPQHFDEGQPVVFLSADEQYLTGVIRGFGDGNRWIVEVKDEGYQASHSCVVVPAAHIVPICMLHDDFKPGPTGF